MAKPRSSRRMNGSAGLERNFFQTSASRLQRGHSVLAQNPNHSDFIAVADELI